MTSGESAFLLFQTRFSPCSCSLRPEIHSTVSHSYFLTGCLKPAESSPLPFACSLNVRHGGAGRSRVTCGESHRTRLRRRRIFPAHSINVHRPKTGKRLNAGTVLNTLLIVGNDGGPTSRKEPLPEQIMAGSCINSRKNRDWESSGFHEFAESHRSGLARIDDSSDFCKVDGSWLLDSKSPLIGERKSSI